MARAERESIQVPVDDTFCTITLEGEEKYTQMIWDAIMAVTPPRLMIGRNTKLTESRTPGLIGVRYLSLVIHKSDLP